MAIVETGPIPTATEETAAPKAARSTWMRLKPAVLALIVPLLLLAFWQMATTLQWTRLIPTPYAVAECMVDFAVGGIFDDAYSATLVTHLLASMSRVYGGFALAALFALPIGLMIGRMPWARMLLDPFLQVMRPIPVTAWLPLSMILVRDARSDDLKRAGSPATKRNEPAGTLNQATNGAPLVPRQVVQWQAVLCCGLAAVSYRTAPQ